MKREVELRTPHTTQAGTAITLTLTVQAEELPDSNYAVVHLAVIPEVRTIICVCVYKCTEQLEKRHRLGAHTKTVSVDTVLSVTQFMGLLSHMRIRHYKCLNVVM